MILHSWNTVVLNRLKSYTFQALQYKALLPCGCQDDLNPTAVSLLAGGNTALSHPQNKKNFRKKAPKHRGTQEFCMQRTAAFSPTLASIAAFHRHQNSTQSLLLFSAPVSKRIFIFLTFVLLQGKFPTATSKEIQRSSTDCTTLLQ